MNTATHFDSITVSNITRPKLGRIGDENVQVTAPSWAYRLMESGLGRWMLRRFGFGYLIVTGPRSAEARLGR